MESDCMPNYEIFAKRGRERKFDVLEYDEIPPELRVQVHYIWKDALEIDRANDYGIRGNVSSNFSFIRNHLCRELGIESLYPYGHTNMTHTEECEYYLKKGDNPKIWLSLVELSMLRISDYRDAVGGFDLFRIVMNQEEAIAELNHRFRENGMGYEFSNGIIIRKDSEILHEEVVKPALYLLQDEEFDGALEEFLKAHNHYREGNYEECVVYAGRAFESTMRIIGDRKGWGLKGKENASELIAIMISNELIPVYFQNALQGLGTLRNQVAHGKGVKDFYVSDYFVNYAMHLCGTNIVMLIEAYKKFSK